jgi:hypothetical protein
MQRRFEIAVVLIFTVTLLAGCVRGLRLPKPGDGALDTRFAGAGAGVLVTSAFPPGARI